MELSSLIDIKKISTKKGVSKSEVSKSEVSKSGVKTVPGLKKISLSPKMKKRSSKKRHSIPTKTTKPTKDIFQIEQHIQKLSSTKSKVEKSEKKVDPKVSSNNNANQENNEKVSSNSGKMKVNKKRTRNRSRRRSHSKSKRNMMKGRQVKVKPAKVSEDDLAIIKKRIKNIRDKSSKEIKEDLRKKGIQVSGKSDRLLKDIYFYSKVCNLNIVHEK